MDLELTERRTYANNIYRENLNFYDNTRLNWRLECNQKGDKKAALQQPHGNGHTFSLPLSHNLCLFRTFLVEIPARIMIHPCVCHRIKAWPHPVFGFIAPPSLPQTQRLPKRGLNVKVAIDMALKYVQHKIVWYFGYTFHGRDLRKT